MYQASERCGGGIHLVDRLFLRNTVYVGGYKDGRKGDCPVSDCAGSAIFLLYCRISCFALVSLYISAVPVESDKDSNISLFAGGWDSAGVLCESGYHADVYWNTLVSIIC